MTRKKVKGTRFLIGIGIFFISLGVLLPSEAVVDRIVAVVNQEIITLSEVEKWSQPFQREIHTDDRLERKEKVQEVLRKVLERIIEDKLLEQEAKKSGTKVTSKEVEGAIDEIRRRNNLDQESFERALVAQGFTLESLKKELEKKILRMKFVAFAVQVEPKAGEKELREFYQKNLDLYRVDESYRPAHILLLVSNEATPEQVREIRKRIQKILERIKGGESFAKMAQDYSEDPSSSKEGGDLGYFKKGELVPALEKETMRLRVGEVSGIIQTELGFHILKLVDRKGGEPAPLEEVKEKVQADYYEKRLEKAYQEFLSKLKEKSIIEIML